MSVCKQKRPFPAGTDAFKSYLCVKELPLPYGGQHNAEHHDDGQRHADDAYKQLAFLLLAAGTGGHTIGLLLIDEYSIAQVRGMGQDVPVQ